MPTAQALLKTLEEPPPRTLLILILANVRALPPTVLSRCQLVRFRPLPEADAVAVLAEGGVEPEGARLLARLCRGQVGRALAGEPGSVRARRDAALELLGTPRVRLAAGSPIGPIATPWPPTWRPTGSGSATPSASPRGAIPPSWSTPTARRSWPPWRGALPALADAIAVVKEARLALDVNVSPRLALERALLVLAPAA